MRRALSLAPIVAAAAMALSSVSERPVPSCPLIADPCWSGNVSAKLARVGGNRVGGHVTRWGPGCDLHTM